MDRCGRAIKASSIDLFPGTIIFRSNILEVFSSWARWRDVPDHIASSMCRQGIQALGDSQRTKWQIFLSQFLILVAEPTSNVLSPPHSIIQAGHCAA